MANRLKHMILKSVDLVRRGANPDADIKLYKSADAETPILKSADEVDVMVNKSMEATGTNLDCLYKSYKSIMDDQDITDSEARDLLAKSLVQFNEAMYNDIIKSYSFEKEPAEEDDVTAKYGDMLKSENLTDEEKEQLSALIGKACGKVTKKCGKVTKAEDEEEDSDYEEEDDIEDSEDYSEDDEIEESEDEYEDDGEEDDAEYQDDTGDEEPEDDTEEDVPEEAPETKPVTKKCVKKACKKSDVAKSAAYKNLLKKQEENIAVLQKRFDMQELTEIAKKYETIGEDPDKLAETLYEMKQAGDGIYKSYLDNLDKTLSLYEKSSVFGEIGKSFAGPSSDDPESRIEQIAKSYIKSQPGMNYIDAKAKAWSDHPEIALEYEQNRRR